MLNFPKPIQRLALIPHFVAYAGSIVRAVTAVAVCSTLTFAQPKQTQSATTETWFDDIIGRENSGIINGPEYKVQLLGARTNPFLASGEGSGLVTYNNNVYSVPLIYDIYKDELVVKHLSGSGHAWFVQLEKSQVKEFVLSGRLFRNFGSDRGYQEVLYDGANFQVLAKRTKTYEVRKGIFNYYEFNRNFIKDARGWKGLSGASGLARVIEDKADKKALKDFLNENKIKRKPSDSELARAAAFADELITKGKQ
jgi:hypothetical protein